METTKTLPRISIVTPSYNQSGFLEDTILSVLEQNYPNLEYVVVDGGSTDGSVDIIKKYAKHLTWWVSEKDNGQSHALNKGFAKTTGEIMAYINSDDKYFPWAFKTVGRLFYEFPQVEWLTSIAYLCWNSEGEPIPGWHMQGFTRRDFYKGRTLGNSKEFLGWIQQESTFWKRSLWEKSGAYVPENLHYAMDFDMWARFFEHAYLYGVPLPLGGYRFQANQKIAGGIEQYYEEAGRILADHRSRGGALLKDSALKSISYNFSGAKWDIIG